MAALSGFNIATNTNTNVADAYTLAQFSELFVPYQTSVFATGSTFSGVVSTSGASVENHGTIAGFLYGIKLGAAGAFSTVVNGTDGTISNYVFNGAAISLFGSGANSGYSLYNYGQVTSASGAPAIVVSGQGQIVNSGTITSSAGTAISQTDTTAGETFSFTNTETGVLAGGYNGSTSTITESLNNRGIIRGNVTLGSGDGDNMTNSGSQTISGTVTFGNGNNDHFQNFAGMSTLIMGNGNNDVVLNFGTIGNITMGSGSNDYVGNAGRINGNVQMGAGFGQVFDSTLGTIFAQNTTGKGTITAGSTGSTIVGALNGGSLIGGNGNDVLIANQTQMAADNAAQTTLDGKGGTNAMYGGGGFNTFISGDTVGGYNQIWGSPSDMNGIGGYGNNTLSYATATGGVFVDLLNGHNAYVANVGNSWTGSGTYEDSISNVPNVVGSTFGDIIQADNGIDRVTGGGKADQLYAGSGGSSQDTFVYTQYSDSNVVTGYDTIVGFKLGTDKIDLSAFNTNGAHLALSTAGTSNTVYLEQTAGSFNAATDLAMIVNTTAAGGLHASDFIF